MKTFQDSYIAKYQTFLEGTEVQDLFAVWAGIAAGSAILGRGCFLDMGTYTLYPNFYICLVAGPGVSKKSTAIQIMKKYTYKLEPHPNLMQNWGSTESFIEALKNPPQAKDGTINLEPNSEGYVFADELIGFLRSYEKGLGTLLLELYNCPERFEYRTVGRGLEKLEYCYFGFIATSTVDLLKQAIPKEAIGQGFTSRMIFVYSKDKKEPRLDTRLSPEQKKLELEIVEDLQRVAKITGPFTLTDEVWKRAEKDYAKFKTTSPMVLDPGLAGYADRRIQHIFKLCIILSASYKDDRIISMEDYQNACNLISITDTYLPDLMRLILSTETGSEMSRIVEFISRKDRTAHTELYHFASNRLSNVELKPLLETLIKSNRVKVERIGSELYYSTPSVGGDDDNALLGLRQSLKEKDSST